MKQMQIQFIHDVGRVWSFYSIHALLVAGALGIVIATLPATGLHVSQVVLGVLVMIAAISGIIGRVVKQDPADAQRIEDLKR